MLSPALPEASRRELVQEQGGVGVARRQLLHLRARVHDVGRVRGVVETEDVPDLVQRHDAHLVRPERPSLGIERREGEDRKSTRLNSSHGSISYAVFCLKKKKK